MDRGKGREDVGGFGTNREEAAKQGKPTKVSMAASTK
jgi:hypothetical protein